MDAALPGSLPAAGGDICCCHTKQIQKQEGKPFLFFLLTDIKFITTFGQAI